MTHYLLGLFHFWDYHEDAKTDPFLTSIRKLFIPSENLNTYNGRTEEDRIKPVHIPDVGIITAGSIPDVNKEPSQDNLNVGKWRETMKARPKPVLFDEVGLITARSID